MQDTQAKARWGEPWWRHPFLKGVPFKFRKILADSYRQNSNGTIRWVKIYYVRLRFLLENKKEGGSEIATAAVIIFTVFFMMVIIGMIMAVFMGMMIVVVLISIPSDICMMSYR